MANAVMPQNRLLEMLCFAFTHPLTISLGQTEAVSGEPKNPGTADWHIDISVFEAVPQLSGVNPNKNGV